MGSIWELAITYYQVDIPGTDSSPVSYTRLSFHWICLFNSDRFVRLHALVSNSIQCSSGEMRLHSQAVIMRRGWSLFSFSMLHDALVHFNQWALQGPRLGKSERHDPWELKYSLTRKRRNLKYIKLEMSCQRRWKQQVNISLRKANNHFTHIAAKTPFSNLSSNQKLYYQHEILPPRLLRLQRRGSSRTNSYHRHSGDYLYISLILLFHGTS